MKKSVFIFAVTVLVAAGARAQRLVAVQGTGSNQLVQGLQAPPPPPDPKNTKYGVNAFMNVITGTNNSAFGYRAMENSSGYAGSGNTAVGSMTLLNYAKGEANTAIGFHALDNNGSSGYNTAVGNNAMATIAPGWSNTAIGSDTGPSVANVFNSTALGVGAKNTATNQVRIGSAGTTSIGGFVAWSVISDARFKRNLKEDITGLDFINGLRPVSYEIDRNALSTFVGYPALSQDATAKALPVRETGFVAQEVEALVKKSGYAFNGVQAPQNDMDPYTLRYSEFVVPLVKAVQELSAQSNAQQKLIEAQQKVIEEFRTKFSTVGQGTALTTGAAGTELYQNAPNPFTLDTQIKMKIADNAMQASVIVYSLEGKQLKDISIRQRGEAAVTIQGNELNPGMYLYTLIVDGKVVDTKRMVLTK